MNFDAELAVEDRLHAQLRELDGIEVPAYDVLRERALRHGSSRLPFALAAAAAVALVVAAILDAQLRGPVDVPGSTLMRPAPATPACGSADERASLGACRLIPARVVEIVGPQALRLTPDSPKVAAEFENPALFEADARTRIEPTAATIAATGVTAGAQVQVAFDDREPTTATGAHRLTRLVVVHAGGAPDCANGSPLMDISRFPQGTVHGGATPESAFRDEHPAARDLSTFPFRESITNAPVWIVAGTETFLATILPDGSWFVSPAKFVRCVSIEEIQSRSATRTRDPNATPLPTPSGSPLPGPFTPEQVAAGISASAVVFAETDPRCVRGANANVFRCTLSRAPAPESSGFLARKEPLAIARWIVGGCVALDRDGLAWECYIGQDAVDNGIIGPDLLGQWAPVPGRG